MKITKTTLTAMIAAGGLFAASSALLAADAAQPAPARPAQGGGQGGGGQRGQRGGPTIEQLTEQLKLTDAQKPKVQAALEERNKKSTELRASNAPQEEMRTKRQAIQADFSKKMKEILTPEQFTKWEAEASQQRGQRQGGGANAAPAEKPAAPAAPAAPAPEKKP